MTPDPKLRLARLAGHLLPPGSHSNRGDVHAQAVSQKQLSGKVAIVTGSSSGVGAALVVMLAERGCDVVVNFSRSKGPAEQVAEKCKAHGVRVLLCQADVASDEGCAHLVKATIDTLGRIDFLVNNAGTTKFVAHDNLDGLTAEDFHRIYDLNAVGPWRMIKMCAPHMKKLGAGRIVNVSSIAGAYQSVGSSVAYLMSKAALNALTTSMGKVLGPEIVVNAVCPGFIAGEWLREGMGPQVYDFVKGALEEKLPMRTVSQPANVAASILMLLEASSTHITGQCIVCDAGLGLHRGPLG